MGHILPLARGSEYYLLVKEQPLGAAASERFEIRRRLGEGGMGIVYEAFDRQDKCAVAIKVLRRLDGQALYRFKREFRALRDLLHPNLVGLGELIEDGGEWFFTMELVRGKHFLDFVRTRPVANPLGQRTTSAGRPAAVQHRNASKPALVAPPDDREGPGYDESRLRRALAGMVRGLAGLHAAGKVHRDVKPSNVVVTSEGRVVLLDFGLVSVGDVGDGVSMDTLDGSVVGTPVYMSPEQATGAAVSPASDLYSVGVMLYEALCGAVPFDGAVLEVMTAKQSDDPVPPSVRASGVPADLETICMRLLDRDPATRLGGAEVLAALGVDSAGEVDAPSRPSRRAMPFEGREQELGRLHACFDRLRDGAPVAALIRGPSGIGKTRLVREFVARLRDVDDRVVLLEGRCYEREAIAFKAVDSLVDHLTKFWRTLPRAEAAALTPHDVSYLPRLFPVLERVSVVADAPYHVKTTDPSELRNRAFGAFREVLERLGERQPLIVFLDDMQWVDADSITLLFDVLRPPDSPRFMLVLSTRGDGESSSDHQIDTTRIDGFTEVQLDRLGVTLDTIDLAPLGRRAAKRLAQQLLGSKDVNLLARVATDSKGSPYYLGELARYIRDHGDDDSAEMTLNEIVNHRIAGLSREAKRLLGMVVLAGEPVALQVIARAADVDLSVAAAELRALRSASFVRAAGGRATDRIEPYHGRIASVVEDMLSAERRVRYHRNLAVALVEFEGSDEQLARHWMAAGEPARGAQHAMRAGRSAVETLDFGRAARLFRLVLDVGEEDEASRRRLHKELAYALVNAGSGAEGAEVYLAAAEGAPTAERVELQRRGAEQLLLSGQVERGEREIGRVLAEVGLSMPATDRAAITRLALGELRLRLRGLGWKARDVSEVSPIELIRADTCWSAGAGLVLTSFLLGPVFSKKALLLSLGLGEPLRIARNAASEAILVAIAGKTARAERLLALSTDAAEAHGTTLASFYPVFGRALIDYAALFRLDAAIEGVGRAETIWHEAGRGRAWELDMCALFGSLALLFRGDLTVLAKRVATAVRSAERSSNAFAAANLRARMVVLGLRGGDWRMALADVEDATEAWRPGVDEFDQPRLFSWFARTDVACYRGELGDEEDSLERDCKRFEASLWRRVPVSRIDGRFACARLALLRARRDRENRAAALASAGANARLLSREKLGLAGVYENIVRGVTARLEGDEHRAIEHLRVALRRSGELDLGLIEASLEYVIGEAIGGTDGEMMVDSAGEWLRGHGVTDLARMVGICVPAWNELD